jgi:hypothetical protein
MKRKLVSLGVIIVIIPFHVDGIGRNESMAGETVIIIAAPLVDHDSLRSLDVDSHRGGNAYKTTGPELT